MSRSTIKKLKPAFGDERGEIWDIAEGGGIQHVGLIKSKKGAVRANHYHKKATQYTFILKGKVEWYTKDLRDDSAETTKTILEPGDLAIDPPEVAHAMVAMEDTEFLDMTDVSRESGGYEEDTIRIKLV